MASNINPYNVDGNFPLAGQDNPSQGFRDNFTNTKNNFLYAQAEITDLQEKAILIQPLNGQSLNNDMVGTTITRPQLKAWTQAILDLGAGIGSVSLDFSLANFQRITTAGSISVTLDNWPTSTGGGALGYGVLRLWLTVTSAGHTVTLPTEVTIGVNDIAGATSDGTNYTITFDAPGNYVFDFSSVDGGTNFLIFDVSRNRSTFRDPDFYYNSGVNSTVLIGYGLSPTAYALAQELESGNDKVSTLGSYNSVTIGNLGMANVSYPVTDSGVMGGFSVTAARGNIYTQSTLTSNCAVQSTDYLGSFNAYAYTGTGTTNSNIFQLSSGISMFATGSNVQYGLGGNIAFFVAPNGRAARTASSIDTVQQAVGVENDKSVKFFGNVILSTSGVPATSSSIGTAGQVAYDASYLYMCTATNTWKRTSWASSSW